MKLSKKITLRVKLIKRLFPKLVRLVKLLTKVVLLLILLTIISLSVYKITATRYQYDYALETELKYWDTKNKIINEISEFIKNGSDNSDLSPIILLNLCDKYDIDVRLALAQGKVESHFGTKGLARRTNSVWNMGAYDGYKIDEILGIYKYPHPNKSIEPYLKSIKYNYLGGTKIEYDLLNDFVNRSGHRYASYPNYENELKIVWEEINTTTELDSLLSIYKKYRLELNR